MVIKDEDIFFLSEQNGNVPLDNSQGFGLYYHDCRFLDGYELRIAGSRPNALSSTSEHGFMSEFLLTNPDVRQIDGQPLAAQRVGIRWRRLIQATNLTLQEMIEFTNHSADSIQFAVSLDFDAGFADVFEIRGLHPARIGKAQPPSWTNGTLIFEYSGADGLYRNLQIAIQPPLSATRKAGADLKIVLAPGENKRVHLSLSISESRKSGDAAPQGQKKSNTHHLADGLRQDFNQCLRNCTRLESSNPLLNKVFERCLRDLRVLRSCLDGREYFSAGLPWYGALFGRDSLISSLQTLAFEPRIAEQTLGLLAKYQGREINEWREEQPGKILHELRRGELAHLNEIRQTPYYGSVDSTPLFLILAARHAQWTGDLSLFDALKPTIEKAFDWMTRYGDSSGNGYLEYNSYSSTGLANQGWKDSGDAIVNANGTLAKPPIALVEVQGYVYKSKTEMAEVYERAGDKYSAHRLRSEARELQERFERDFWLDDRNMYALALQAAKKPAAVLSSNPGQMLWSGMAARSRAVKTSDHLTSPAMFSGWGVRTLSSEEQRYNPVGYHLGTVWPHDNSLIAAGLRRYGCDDAACRIFAGILEAARHFPRYRLPEVFSGFSTDQFPTPVRYPVACHPQAWAAGSMPFMIETLLGLMPKAFENGLQIVRPVLPDSIDRLELRGLRVGKSCADLRFERNAVGDVATRILKVEGNLDVEVSEEMPRAA